MSHHNQKLFFRATGKMGEQVMDSMMEEKKTDILDLYIGTENAFVLRCCHLSLDYISTLPSHILYALSKKYVKIFLRGSCLMNFTHFLQLETLIILRILQFYSLIKTYNYISTPNQLINCSSALQFLLLFGREKVAVFLRGSIKGFCKD